MLVLLLMYTTPLFQLKVYSKVYSKDRNIHVNNMDISVFQPCKDLFDNPVYGTLLRPKERVYSITVYVVV